MPNRTVVWTLGILALVVVVLPLLSMFGMMSMGFMMGRGGMMGTGGAMMGTNLIGLIWMGLALVVVVALVVLLIRSVGTRTGV